MRPKSAKCVVCSARFRPARIDARYCSSACRQRAHRSRSAEDELVREIDATRRRYWELVRRLECARADAVSAQAQLVDTEGDVYIGGKFVGTQEPFRAGWAAWGLEAARPPFRPLAALSRRWLACREAPYATRQPHGYEPRALRE